MAHSVGIVLSVLLFNLKLTRTETFREYFKAVSTYNFTMDSNFWISECKKRGMKMGRKNADYSLAFFTTDAEVQRAFDMMDDNDNFLVLPQISKDNDEAMKNLFVDPISEEKFKYHVDPGNLTGEDRTFHAGCCEIYIADGVVGFRNRDCFAEKAMCQITYDVAKSPQKHTRKSLKFFSIALPKDTHASFDDLRRKCWDKGGEIAMIKDEQDLKWANGALDEYDRALIGARQIGNSSKFKNVDGSFLDLPQHLWFPRGYITKPCVGLALYSVVDRWRLTHSDCLDNVVLCQYGGHGVCKFDTIGRNLQDSFIGKAYENVPDELSCINKCEAGCTKCIMFFSPFVNGKNCFRSTINVVAFHRHYYKEIFFKLRQDFDVKWGILVPREGRSPGMQPMPDGLWPLNNATKGRNVMEKKRHKDCSTTNLKWTEIGPDPQSQYRYARGGKDWERIYIGEELESPFTLATWIKTDANSEHGLPIFEGEPWDRSFSLLFAASKLNELHLDTNDGSFHTVASSSFANEWRHVAMVWKQDMKIEFYINAQPVPLIFQATSDDKKTFLMKYLCLFATCDGIPLRGSLACVAYFRRPLQQKNIIDLIQFCP